MAPKPRNKAGMDAAAVAALVAAQDEDDTAPVAEAVPQDPVPRVPAATAPPTEPLPMPAFDPGKVDGRTLRRTGREPFATRIKPETHEALRRIAYHRRITIAEALEMAVAAFDRG